MSGNDKKGRPPLCVAPSQFPFTTGYMIDAAVFLAQAITEAKQGQARFVLFGDFDVDGTSSAAILSLYFRLYGVDNVSVFVSRRKDGYGLSQKSLERLMTDIRGVRFEGKTYVVMMDLGVNTTAEAAQLLQLGDDGAPPVAVMVIDHHVPSPTAAEEWRALAEAHPGNVFAFDPLLSPDPAERYFKCLSAAGLVQRLNEVICDADIQGLGMAVRSKLPATLISNNGLKRSISRRVILNTIEKIAAIAQASDVMPFADGGILTAAWAMAKKFEDASGSLLPGVAELYKKTNTASRIGWVIGPILNAAGRLEDAYASYDLMTEISDADARGKIQSIEETRARVQSITADAWTVMDDMLKTERGVCVVLMDRDRVGPGIMGIAASRSSEKYGRPSVCLIEDETDDGVRVLKGSMRRGHTDFSCEAWILSLKREGIAIAGGGHPAAAGMTILVSQYQRFIESAEAQIFQSTAPAVYQVAVREAHDHLKASEAIMPFGNGNMAARLRIDGIVTAIRPLIRKDDAAVWCYLLNVAEVDDPADFAEIKVMSRDLSREAAEMFLSFTGKQIHLPATIEFEVFDGLRAGFSSRGEFRAAATIRSDHAIRGAHRAWLDLHRETESGSFAHIHIKTPPVKIAQDDADEGESTTGLSDDRDGARAVTQEDTAPLSLKRDEVDDLTVTGGGSEGHQDIAMIAAYVERATADANSYLVTCAVDHDDGLPFGTFLIKRPGKNEILSLIGEDGMTRLTAAHGGRWSPELKGYLVASGVISTLKPCESGCYHFIFTKRAVVAAAQIDAHHQKLLQRKADDRPFPIPFLREGKVPFGFQYADVRSFLSKDVSLCYNDMGTGKTFEAAMWGALQYASSIIPLDLKHDTLDDTLSDYVRDVERQTDRTSARPILVATMASIAGQFSSEMESFLNLPATVLSTDVINSIVEASGVKMTKKEKGLNQIHAPNQKLVAYFREHVFSKNAFIVATYDCLSRHPWVVSLLPWSGVVCDEAHELKGSNTFKTKAIFGAGVDLAPLRREGGVIPLLAMSGTFPKNRPGDWFVWTRLTRADGGVYTDGALSDAQRRFDRRFDGLYYKEIWLRRGGGPARKIIIPDRGAPENSDELKAILAPHIVRRLKDELNDLPPMHLHVRRLPSNGLYMDILTNLRTGQPLNLQSRELLSRHNLLSSNGEFLDESGEDADVKPAVSAASLAGKLSLISSLDKASGGIKTLTALDWIGAAAGDEAFAVVAFHRSAVREISRALTEAGVSHFTMTQEDSIEERERKKQAFQSGERQAFVTTYGVGGTGLNLTRASRMALAGLPWTDSAMVQARDRIFRIGQTKPTKVVILLLAASIDESTYFMIRNKGRANFKTAAVDQMRRKGAALPGWATGSVLDFNAPDKTPRSGDERERKDPDERVKTKGSGWLSP